MGGREPGRAPGVLAACRASRAVRAGAGASRQRRRHFDRVCAQIERWQRAASRSAVDTGDVMERSSRRARSAHGVIDLARRAVLTVVGSTSSILADLRSRASARTPTSKARTISSSSWRTWRWAPARSAVPAVNVIKHRLHDIWRSRTRSADIDRLVGLEYGSASPGRVAGEIRTCPGSPAVADRTHQARMRSIARDRPHYGSSPNARRPACAKDERAEHLAKRLRPARAVHSLRPCRQRFQARRCRARAPRPAGDRGGRAGEVDLIKVLPACAPDEESKASPRPVPRLGVHSPRPLPAVGKPCFSSRHAIPVAAALAARGRNSRRVFGVPENADRRLSPPSAEIVHHPRASGVMWATALRSVRGRSARSCRAPLSERDRRTGAAARRCRSGAACKAMIGYSPSTVGVGEFVVAQTGPLQLASLFA